MELSIRRPDAPYIVKAPSFCDYAKEVLSDDSINIEHVIIPIRNLTAAAESRRFVSGQTFKASHWKNKLKYILGTKVYTGGLFGTNYINRHMQEQVLQEKIYTLFYSLSSQQIPITLINFPKSVKDSKYLYLKLKPVLLDIGFQKFSAAFNQVADVSLVNDFKVKVEG